ncbi:MAG: N-acetyltransferase family protein [Planctomycetota bacterium]|nr:N-acetyltransferase family protein [Planctomycetota bacterium]
MNVRSVEQRDFETIVEIYNHYVQTTVVTFEEESISVLDIENRIKTITTQHPWLVLENDGQLVGYAYGSPFRARPAYRFTVETTIYLDPDAGGKGFGTHLYGELLRQLEIGDFRTALGVIALPNPSSVRLHEKLGFEKVAHLQGVGRKFDRWIDTGYWQMQLDSFDASD